MSQLYIPGLRHTRRAHETTTVYAFINFSRYPARIMSLSCLGGVLNAIPSAFVSPTASGADPSFFQETLHNISNDIRA